MKGFASHLADESDVAKQHSIFDTRPYAVEVSPRVPGLLLRLCLCFKALQWHWWISVSVLAGYHGKCVNKGYDRVSHDKVNHFVQQYLIYSQLCFDFFAQLGRFCCVIKQHS